MSIPYANQSVKPTNGACPIATPEALHAHFLQVLPRIEEHAQVGVQPDRQRRLLIRFRKRLDVPEHAVVDRMNDRV